MFVDLLGIPYLVTFEPNEEKVFGGCAHFCSEQQDITIYSGQGTAQQKAALFHELVHLADRATIAENDTIPEEDICRIASTLFGILRENEDARRWLFDRGVNSDE